MTTAAAVSPAPAEMSSAAPRARTEPRRERYGALALYVVLSVGLIGLHVIRHLGSRAIAMDDVDSSQFMWFFAWWPHALLHGLNPFVTHLMFVPQGFNLTWATSMPGPSLVMAPVTLAFGPVVTWNLIELAAPALSAWVAYLLCRELTGRLVPSLIGGYIFGFSPFVLKHLTGGPYLALAPLLPLFVLLALRWLRGTTSSRRFLVAMTAALTAQYLISAEVLLTSTLMGGVALGLAFVLCPDLRHRLLGLVKLLAGAYLATLILIIPFLLFFFLGQQYPPGATFYPADLTTYAIPPPLVVALTRHAPPFAGSNDESYLGLPLLLIIGLFTWRRRRDRASWILVGTALVAFVLSLGSRLVVRGHLTSIPLPWKLIGRLPVLRYSIPLRFAEYVVLAAAVITAVWCSDVRGRSRNQIVRWALAAAALLFILPDVGSTVWNTPAQDPPFFAGHAYRSYLKPADHVLTIPAWGPNERWQADTGFRFKLAGGYAGNPFPPSYTRYPIWSTLTSGTLIPNYPAELRRFIRDKGVTAIVVDETQRGPWRQLFATLGVRPTSTGGVLLYRLHPVS